MKWNLGRRNPGDPFTSFYSYKWLITRHLAAAIGRTAPHAKGRLLDVGCGERRFAGYFNVERYIGLEYPTTYGQSRSTVDVFGTALQLPFAEATFDTVVSFETLEHVTDTTAMVRELRRVVKPGGAVILTVPFLWGEHCQPHDYYRFTAMGLAKVFEASGLTVAHQERVGGFWTFFGQRLAYYVAEVYGRNGWMTRMLAFGILTCASLLYALDASNWEYSGSVIVGYRPQEEGA